MMNCPRCGSLLVKKTGKCGPLIGCSSYPECKYTQNINKQSKEGIIVSKEEHPKSQDNLDIVDIRPFYAKSLQDNLEVSFFQSLAIPFNFLNTYFNHQIIKQLKQPIKIILFARESLGILIHRIRRVKYDSPKCK